MPTARSVIELKAVELLRALAELPGSSGGVVRVAAGEGELACLIQVWPAGMLMPTASAERGRVAGGSRAKCRGEVLAAVRAAGRSVTRKEVIKALRAGGAAYAPGTVGKVLADLTAAGELVNPRDKRGYRLPDWPRRPRTKSLF